MKKMWITAVVLLVAAGTCLAETSVDVKAFMEKIKAANPTDQWLQEGTIRFTCASQRDGASTVIGGTLEVKERSMLMRREFIEGLHVKPLDNGMTLAPITGLLVVSVVPDKTTFYTPDARSVSIWKNSSRLGTSNFGPFHVGTAPGSVLSGVDSGAMKASITANTLTVGQTQITCDADGRITETLYTNGDDFYRVQADDFIELGGKHLAQAIIVTTKQDGRLSRSDYALQFFPGTVKDDAFEINPVYGSVVREVDSDGDKKPREYWLSSDGKPVTDGIRPALPNETTATVKTAIKDVPLSYLFPPGYDCCDHWCFSIRDCPCALGCPSTYGIYWEHRCCMYKSCNVPPNPTCTGYTTITYETCPCQVDPYFGWDFCPMWGCYMEGSTWESYACCYNGDPLLYPAWCDGSWCD